MDNGCGPEWMSKYPITDKIRGWLWDWFHEASCDKHDEGYRLGGTEVRREYCDIRFYQAMLNDADKIHSYFYRFLAKKQAWVFFKLVRKFGSRHFNYHSEGM